MDKSDQTDQTPYQFLGGEEAVRQLSNAFYDAMDTLPEAYKIRSMHAEQLVEIKQKFYEYLSGWLGGPNLYFEKYHTNSPEKPYSPFSVAGLVYIAKMHKPYRIGGLERDQWLRCMKHALEAIHASEETKQLLMPAIFELANFIRNDD